MTSRLGAQLVRPTMILAAFLRAILVFGLALAAVSCSSPPVEPPVDTVNPVVPEPPPAPPVAVVAPSPPPKPAPKPAKPVTTAVPITVIGLSETNVEALFGPPATRAKEGPGHTWRYVSGNCSVTLFFFLDVNRNESTALDHTVTHNDFYALDQKVTGVSDGDAGAQRCLRRIADAKPH